MKKQTHIIRITDECRLHLEKHRVHKRETINDLLEKVLGIDND